MSNKTRIQYTECPNGHRLKLVIVDDSPNLIQMLKCPACGDERVGLVGQLLSVSSTNEPCPEKILLLNAYEQKAAQYSQAALELKDKVRNIPQIELNVLWAAAEQARIACEKARELLQQHAAAHGCGPRQP